MPNYEVSYSDCGVIGMILPRVKSIKISENIFRLPINFSIQVDSAIAPKSKLLLEKFLLGCEVDISHNKNYHIIASKKAMKDEEYNLYIDNNGIKIEYTTYRGLRNAVASIAILAKKEGEYFSLPYTAISDFPVASYRGVLIDLGRGTKPVDELLEDIVLMAKMKMNYLHLHLVDHPGLCVQLDSLPIECCLNNPYTKEEMQRVIELADVLALDIIPEFDMPAHSKKLIKCFSELGCDIEDENTGWTICAGEEKVYKLFEEVIKELATMFPGDYIHIGGDELDFADVPHLKYLCHWDNCVKCKNKCKEEGLKNRQELYYYFIKRIYEIVKKFGKKMIMWSDQLDCSKEIPLPKDIIMQYWRIAAPGRGPVEGCSMEAQLEAGYVLINSPYEYVYGDLEGFMRAEKIKNWHWENCALQEDNISDKIIGSELCEWEYGNDKKYPHYKYSFAPSVVVMADKLWNGDNLEFTEQYSKGVTKAIIGTSTPDNLDLFKFFGSVIPPKDDKLAYIDNVKCNKSEFKETIKLLENISNNKRCSVYKKCLEDIMEKYSNILK